MKCVQVSAHHAVISEVKAELRWLPAMLMVMVLLIITGLLQRSVMAAAKPLQKEPSVPMLQPLQFLLKKITSKKQESVRHVQKSEI